MFTKCLMAFATLSLAVASAATQTVTLYQPAMINGTELKAGEYKMTLDGDRVVLSRGKQKVEAGVMVETTETKNQKTTMRFDNSEGKFRLQEIRPGGTSQRLVITDATAKTGVAKPSTAN